MTRLGKALLGGAALLALAAGAEAQFTSNGSFVPITVAISQLTGLGTGVATALAIATGASGGVVLDNGAWTSYTATATCVTSTCAGSGRYYKASAKTTCVELSVTVSGSSGTITSIALPNTHANQGIAGGVSGRENGVNGLEWVGQITANSGVVSNINLAASSSNAITSGEVITLHGCYENL